MTDWIDKKIQRLFDRVVISRLIKEIGDRAAKAVWEVMFGYFVWAIGLGMMIGFGAGVGLGLLFAFVWSWL